MPLTGEAIRIMNYVDDISTTLRRVLASCASLSPDECKRVGDYLRASTPSVDQVLEALDSK